MSQKAWFVCISNEVLGPLSASLLTKMVEQQRVTSGDYVWSEPMKTWTQVAACAQFADLLPSPPQIPIPRGNMAAPAAAPAPAPTPKTKAAPAPAPVEAEAEAEVEVETEPEVEEAPVAKPAAKPVKAGKAKLEVVKPRAPVAPPEPEVREFKFPLDATVKVSGGPALKVLDITETGLDFEKSDGIELGADVKIKLESPSLAKSLDLTAVTVRDESVKDKPAIGVEFTRVNPAHKRAISQYIAEKQGIKKDKSAA